MDLDLFKIAVGVAGSLLGLTSVAAPIALLIRQIGQIAAIIFPGVVGNEHAEDLSTDATRIRTKRSPTASLAQGARLYDLEVALRDARRDERWNKVFANTLTVTQWILGAAVASSFVKDLVTDRTWLGAAGLLVLLSSVAHQHFRPDLRARIARKRRLALQALLRRAEDVIFDLSHVSDATDVAAAVMRLRAVVSGELTRIERIDGDELPSDDAKAKLNLPPA